ncbi:class I SAM-dependent methyltransferase [bacterium]|nr:class I SAM-dependent methyltransferase [bacterium]
MPIKKDTIDYYNKNSQSSAKRFAEFGGRYDIEGTLSLLDGKNPKVLEIGCGAGRDAERILKYTNDYLGFDISKQMVNLAKKNVPSGKFLVKDLENYNFPQGLDFIFALTSLLHSNKGIIKKVFKKISHNLNSGGIFYISLKYGRYHREIIKDELGARVFYFYTPKDIINMAGKKFKILYKDVHVLKGRKFFIIILQKI